MRFPLSCITFVNRCFSALHMLKNCMNLTNKKLLDKKRDVSVSAHQFKPSWLAVFTLAQLEYIGCNDSKVTPTGIIFFGIFLSLK